VPPRLLLDENVTWELAAALRQRGHDVLHVRDLGLLGADDEVVFAAAIRVGRVVVTYDIDFMSIAHRMAERGDHHFGLVLTRRPSFRELLAGTLRLLGTRTPEDLHDAVIWM
jgi:arginase family enzyme